ncbi:MAG: hypothetical protein JW909_12640 [Planctomycetes bacterium]|nr:hypothetical protein [Planctomycetota bacterium]
MLSPAEDSGFRLQGDGHGNLTGWNAVAAWVVTGLCAAFCFQATVFPLVNTDIWWHLSAGRHMVAHGGFIRQDPFAFAPEHSPWVNLHWLFQLAAYCVHSAAGVNGLILAKAGIFMVSCVLLVLSVRDGRTLAFSAVFHAVLMYQVRFLILVRPIVFTLLFLSIFLLVLEEYGRGGKKRILWVLPVVQVLWVNMQGLFVLGPVVVLCYLAGWAAAGGLAGKEGQYIEFETPPDGGRLKTLLWFFLGTCAACFVNPYGYRGVLLPALLYSRIQPGLSDIYAWNVSENLPTWHILETSPWILPYLKWFGVAAVGSFIAARRKFSAARFLLFAAFFYLGLMAERNLSLYFFVLGPVTVGNLNAALKDVEPGRFRRVARVFRIGIPVAGLAVLLLLSVAVIRSNAMNPAVLGTAPFRYPEEAAEILAARPFEGNVFNSVRYGGYLIWRLYPGKKVSADGRLAIRSRKAFRSYLELLDCPEAFHGYSHAHGITRVLLPAAVFRRYLPLIKWLHDSPDWDLVYCDGASVLFAGAGTHDMDVLDLFSPADVSMIEAGLEKRFSGNAYVYEAGRRNLGALLLYVGSLDQAGRILAELPSDRSKRLLARCRYHQGRIYQARGISMRLLEREPGDTDSLNLLGQTYLDEKDYKTAVGYFSAALRSDPYSSWAKEGLKSVEKELDGSQGESGRRRLDVN